MKKIVSAASADFVELSISRAHAQQISNLKSTNSRWGTQPKMMTEIIRDLQEMGMIAWTRFTPSTLYPTNLGLAALNLYLAYGGEIDGRES
ncbi:hypothetical protein [Duganella qianjiadongensis]|uniref:Uncharacterized protein n=1 Tax=Duganella qianjiadongensis TaxID=2692176 RepID=A0ABW9VJ88_9BURK|nr:hypothetical protein [Duganella qianjiadongensis]MYM39649.1 hypothetical protein [Duganella qianjiadongensis]